LPDAGRGGFGLGIDSFQPYRDIEGRPPKVLDEGRVILQRVS
jgi:hypothetical protein